MSLKSGHRMEPLSEEEHEQIQSFEGHRMGGFRLQPDGWFFAKPFAKFADRIYDFQFKPTDVVIMTYPKCGTTWTQEIVWTMLHSPNFDHPNSSFPLMVRAPFLEFDFIWELGGGFSSETAYDTFKQLFPQIEETDSFFLKLAEVTDDPRVIKTHLPFSLLSPHLLNTCKVIYVVRNPKDVATSYEHHSRLLNVHGYKGTSSEFVDHFINNRLIYGPYWTHVKEAWSRRHHPNLHFCFFEDMKADPKRAILGFQKFLGTTFGDKKINEIVEYTSFSSMKSREKAIVGSVQFNREGLPTVDLNVEKEGGGFLRKGVVGDWKNKLGKEEAEKIDEWTKANTRDLGINFNYSLE